MKENYLVVLIPITTLFFTIVSVYFIIIVPSQNQERYKTWAEFNATNTCTGLILLDYNLDNNLPYTDAQDFKNEIKHKIKELNCP